MTTTAIEAAAKALATRQSKRRYGPQGHAEKKRGGEMMKKEITWLFWAAVCVVLLPLVFAITVMIYDMGLMAFIVFAGIGIWLSAVCYVLNRRSVI